MSITTFLFCWIITLNGDFESDECNTDAWITYEGLGYCTLDEQISSANICDFDIIDSSISSKEFKSKYLNKKPVLINTKLIDWSNPQFWEISNLLRLFPKYKFQTGSSTKIIYNTGGTTMTLQEYLNSVNHSKFKNDEPIYIFDRNIFGLNITLFVDNIKLPEFIGYPLLHYQDIYDISSASIYGIFMFGPQKTGAAFHAHDTAIAALAKGSKHWFVYPPSFPQIGSASSSIHWYNTYLKILKNTNVNINTISVDNYSDIIHELRKYDDKVNIDGNKRLEKEIENLFSAEINTINDVLSNINTLSKYYSYNPLECVQNAGQLLYLPDGWAHCTINLNDVIGISIQKQLTYTGSNKYPPTGSQNMFIRGNKVWTRNDRWNAETFFLKAILMDPTYIEPYIALAKLYLVSLDDYYIAERLLRIAYILNNKNEETISLLKSILTKQQKQHLLYHLDDGSSLPQ